MPGEIRGDVVVVREQAEANRLYNKGHHGRPLSGGSLELDLVEAAYLVHQSRLEVHDRSGALSRERLVLECVAKQPEFEIRFLAYREYRDGGRMVHPAPPRLREVGVDFLLPLRDSPKKTEAYVRAVSERAPAELPRLVEFAAQAAKDGVTALVAVVDEESDVTQYALSWEDPHGAVDPATVMDVEADLIVDRIVVWEEGPARKLHEREFFGRLVGNQLHLSLVEGMHLASRGCLRVRGHDSTKPLSGAQLGRLVRRIEPGIDLRSRVYEDLKRRRLVPKTGYKFGTHFRAYERDPDDTHAPFLVHVVSGSDVLDWPTVSRAVRLAHGVRKTLLLALGDPEPVRYLALRRAG